MNILNYFQTLPACASWLPPKINIWQLSTSQLKVCGKAGREDSTSSIVSLFGGLVTNLFELELGLHKPKQKGNVIVFLSHHYTRK